MSDFTQRNFIHGGKESHIKDWIPYEWDDPNLGKQLRGEVGMVRSCGTSGYLTSGFWRIGSTSPLAAPDGSHSFTYSSPAGDDITCVLEGSARLTIPATGETYSVGPGTIITTPRGIEVQYEIAPPHFKTFWCIWSGTSLTLNPPTNLQINHVDDRPDHWSRHPLNGPELGPLVGGEFYYILNGGTSGSFMSGIRRWQETLGGSDVNAPTHATIPYDAKFGDETIFLLEGTVEIIETGGGGVQRKFEAGDVIGLSQGMPVKWILNGSVIKMLWIITHDSLPGV